MQKKKNTAQSTRQNYKEISVLRVAFRLQSRGLQFRAVNKPKLRKIFI
jgi:hypothetical protein